MIFGKTKTIIAIEDNKLKATNVSIKAGKPVVEKRVEKEFTPETLAETLTQVKQELKTDSARVLLSEEKTYLKLLELPLGTGVTRDLVLAKAQEVIPEKLEEGYFDWKQVGANKKSLIIQILAVSKNYLAPIQQVAQKAKLGLEAFESPSFALARLTSGEKEPHLIVYKNDKAVIAAAHKGQVFGAVTAENESQVEKKTKELADFVKEKWGVEIKKTISENLDPVVGLALKEDIKGKDEKVLNLTPPKVAVRVKKEEKMEKPEEVKEETVEVEGERAKETPPMVARRDSSEVEELASVEEKPAEEPVPVPTYSSQLSGIGDKVGNKKFVFAGLIVIAVLALIAGGILVSKRAMSKKEAVPTAPVVSPIPIETPEASPAAELKREDLKLQVLNGAGVAGVAGKAKEFLEGLGYKDIEAGNAETYDYEETEVAIKEDKKAYLELLTDDLSEKYTLSVQTPYVDKDSEFDAIITIGKK